MTINWRMFAELVGFLWRHSPVRQKYLLMSLAMLAGLSRDLVMVVVNKAAGTELDTSLRIWLPVFLVLLATFIGTSFSYQVLTTSVTTEVINRVRTNLIRKLLQMQPTFVERYEHGSLYHILTTDVGTVAGFTSTLLSLLPLVIFLILAIPQLFFYSVVAGLFSVFVMVGGILAYYVQQKSMANLGVDARKWDVAYFENVSGMLSGHRELKLNLKRRNDFLTDLGTVLGNLRTALVAISKVYETGESVVSGLKFALIGGIVFLVPFLYETQSHVVFSLLTLVLFCMTPFEQLVSSYPAIVGTLVSYVRISALEREIAPIHDDVCHEPPQQPFAALALQNAVARHKPHQGKGFVLGPIDLEIRRGEIVFFVGENGSGKTTLLNVLAGLHDLDSGSLTRNGVAANRLGMEEHRADISAVFARFHIFQSLLGLKDVPDDAANGMVAKVGLKEVTSVKAKMLTRTELSAGQRRRLALAIALLEDRDILILDEFVADQDQGQRQFFFNTLLPWLKESGKTVLLSTHDMNWIDSCDRVVTIREGRVEKIVTTKPPIVN